MKEKDFEVPEMNGGDMIIPIDSTTHEYVHGDLVDPASPCLVCGKDLGFPYLWVVPEQQTQPQDFFIHRRCLSALKAGWLFSPS